MPMSRSYRYLHFRLFFLCFVFGKVYLVYTLYIISCVASDIYYTYAKSIGCQLFQNSSNTQTEQERRN